MENVLISIQKLKKTAILPSRQTSGSAGYDIYSCHEKPIAIPVGQVRLIPTGIALAIPRDYEIQIRPRSGLSSKNRLLIINSPGTIDSDYRGEIFVPMMNLGDTEFQVDTGMRIAQMVVSKVDSIVWELKNELDPTSRGEGGFGSSGT